MSTNQDQESQLDVYIGARPLGEQIGMIMPTFEILKEQVEQIRGTIKSALNAKRETNNTIGVFGARGTGKTSAIFTLQQYLTEEKNRSKNILLPIIEPDLFGDNTKIMGSIVGFLKDAIKQLLKQFPKENAVEIEALREYYNNCILKKQNPLWQKLDSLIEYHLYTESEYRTLLTQHYDDLATHINKSSRLLIPDIKFKEKLSELINELASVHKELYRTTEEEVLLFIFIDDIDLKTTKTRELVDSILQYVNHPHVVTVLSGDYDILKESLTMALLRDEELQETRLTPRSRIHSSIDMESGGLTILERKQELAHEYLKKIIPPARRHQLVNWNLETIPQFSFDKVTLLDQLQKLMQNNQIFGYQKPGENTWTPIKNSFVIFDKKPRGLVNVYYHMHQLNQIIAKNENNEKSEDRQMKLFMFVKGLLDTIISSSSSLAANQTMLLDKFLNWGSDPKSTFINYDLDKENSADKTKNRDSKRNVNEPDYRLERLILGEMIQTLLPDVRINEKDLNALKKPLFKGLANPENKSLSVELNNTLRRWNYPLFHIVYGILVNLDTRTSLLLLELLSNSGHEVYYYESIHSEERADKDRNLFICLHQLSLENPNFLKKLYFHSHNLKNDNVNDSINFLNDLCAVSSSFAITEKIFKSILTKKVTNDGDSHSSFIIRNLLINTLTIIRLESSRTGQIEKSTNEMAGSITVATKDEFNTDYRALVKINENLKKDEPLPLEILRVPDRASTNVSKALEKWMSEVRNVSVQFANEFQAALKTFLNYNSGSNSAKINHLQTTIQEFANVLNANETRFLVEHFIELYKEVEALAKNNRVWYGQFEAIRLLEAMRKTAHLETSFLEGNLKPLLGELAFYYTQTNGDIKEDLEYEKIKAMMRVKLVDAYNEVRTATASSLAEFELTLEDDESDAEQN